MDLARESDALREWKLRRASLRPVPLPSSMTATMGDDDGRATAPQEWIEKQQRLRQVNVDAIPSHNHPPISFCPTIDYPLPSDILLSISLACLLACLVCLPTTGSPPTILRPTTSQRRALLSSQNTISSAGREVPHRGRHLAASICASGNCAQTQPTEGTPPPSHTLHPPSPPSHTHYLHPIPLCITNNTHPLNTTTQKQNKTNNILLTQKS